MVVGLSGGVDSALVAALLQERGFDVLGVYLKFDAGNAAGVADACAWKEDIAICRRVAAHLDIAFHVVDATAAYRTAVIEPFIAAYARGETPNPDILCNRWVKFDLLLAEAERLGATQIATGHYARVAYTTPHTDVIASRAKQSRELCTEAERSPSDAIDGDHGDVALLRGTDHEKDQSYFLALLTQEQLRACVFPIGEYTKAQVRAEAERRGLPNWDRRSTRGVCFLGPVDVPI
ncbi:MAG: tRNA-specific 2-thiouridylase, partial [bacterium]|nr:tRNA-specific 2-thiouridylase [bacterium]